MKPMIHYRFTHVRWPDRVFDIWASDDAEARQELWEQNGVRSQYYTIAVIPPSIDATIERDEKLVAQVANYLRDSMGVAHHSRARTILRRVREAEPSNAVSGTPNPLTEASAFIGKHVIVTNPYGAPVGAGMVTSVQKKHNHGITLGIHNFGASEPKEYDYNRYTFTEIDKTN